MVGSRIALKPGADLAGFRLAVRRLVAAGVLPEDVIWDTGDAPDLFGGIGSESTSSIEAEECAENGQGAPVALPRAMTALIEAVICHRDPERYALLYALIWRVLHGERALLDVASDPLVHRLERMRKTVARDLHKMHAFLRFRRTETPEGGERFIAWFEPDHFILEAAAPFFVDRFRALTWSILTPVGSLYWDGVELTIGTAAERQDAPDSDPVESGWRGYYESTFNPARLNTTVMRGHMPKKYWHAMPETAAIPHLVQSAQARVKTMLENEVALPLKRSPAKAVAAMAKQAPQSLEALNRIIAGTAPFVPGATRAVLGEGPMAAEIAFVGEQPGDHEDLQGRPFVGPAGQLLDRALKDAGIDRGKSYLTNAVKHFKFEQRGKRRIHQKPTTGEVQHYRWWLLKELDFVKPRLVVALGGTAAFALTGKAMPITSSRGEAVFRSWRGYITLHPAYMLRLPDAAKEVAYESFVADLRRSREIAATCASEE
ncbi:UdgX family uracil-DNA binding protein [Dongia soli]|uniref:Type-4 uracil-DNA glycosylase n=1 Tax=Dongia soli TaxID=600628 RepID=A0ABU5EDU2_9PROT|nr:UdgX family uracil-DNA binding protein [Dongia soli]MDY0884077.1 UdgX family uracil-DNA binding protein [Dongia soli]